MRQNNSEGFKGQMHPTTSFISRFVLMLLNATSVENVNNLYPPWVRLEQKSC